MVCSFGQKCPVFLPKKSGIFAKNIRYFHKKSPVFSPKKSGIFTKEVRYFHQKSPAFSPKKSGIFTKKVRYFHQKSLLAFPSDQLCNGSTFGNCATSYNSSSIGILFIIFTLFCSFITIFVKSTELASSGEYFLSETNPELKL
jgi:hypothetical protein